MTPELCAAARAILKWSQQDLADRASISRQTVLSYEAGGNTTKGNVIMMATTLKEHGIEFTGGDELPGLRVLKPELLTLPDGGSGGAGKRAKRTGGDDGKDARSVH